MIASLCEAIWFAQLHPARGARRCWVRLPHGGDGAQPDEVRDLAAKGEALVLKLDVTEQDQIKAADEKFGGIDVLVNNAGIGYFGAVEESEEDEVRRMFEINFFGLSRMIHAALPGTRKRRKGFIVNFSSIRRTRFIPR
jgi:NAD(P)-dependent dehydrogenase (short-subunit alcohol dehydrogenase family)